jgi:hypothetical protein
LEEEEYHPEWFKKKMDTIREEKQALAREEIKQKEASRLKESGLQMMESKKMQDTFGLDTLL